MIRHTKAGAKTKVRVKVFEADRLCAGSQGFTVIELMLVVAILAIVGVGVIVALDGSEDYAAQRVATADLNEIKQAMLRFKQDTGFLPKQGPFGLVADGGAIDPTNGTHWPSFLSSVSAGERTAWFNHPANFYQLIYSSDEAGFTDGGGNPIHPLFEMNPDTGRGWNGPYLSRNGNGHVDIGNGIGLDGEGDPASGAVIANVPAIAGPFIGSPDGSYFVWRAWPGAEDHERWGRPYLAFDLRDPALARVLSMGSNLLYESDEAGLGGDDTEVFVLR